MSDFTPPTADLVVAIMRRLDLYDPKNDAACDAVHTLNARIEHLEAEVTVANNRLGNAVGALVDAGTFCTGPDDVTNGIGRLGDRIEHLEAEVERLTRIAHAAGYMELLVVADQLAEALRHQTTLDVTATHDEIMGMAAASVAALAVYDTLKETP